MDNHNKKFAIALAVTIILLAGGGWLMNNQKDPQKTINTLSGNSINEPVACTMEAQICPDGSAVGRTAPDCKFAPCPEPSATPNDWPIFQDKKQGISWRYPEKLETKYVTTPTWPPILKISLEKFSCKSESELDGQGTTTTIKIIDNQAYCIHQESEGAAGSTFITRVYDTEKNGQLISLSLTLQYPQCLNYEEPQKNDCLDEQRNFSADDLAMKIVDSIK